MGGRLETPGAIGVGSYLGIVFFFNLGLSRALLGDFIFFLWYNAIDTFTILK